MLGGTSGLGNAVARMLGTLGATVILAQRGGPSGKECDAEARRSANDIGAPGERGEPFFQEDFVAEPCLLGFSRPSSP